MPSKQAQEITYINIVMNHKIFFLALDWSKRVTLPTNVRAYFRAN